MVLKGELSQFNSLVVNLVEILHELNLLPTYIYVCYNITAAAVAVVVSAVTRHVLVPSKDDECAANSHVATNATSICLFAN